MLKIPLNTTVKTFKLSLASLNQCNKNYSVTHLLNVNKLEQMNNGFGGIVTSRESMRYFSSQRKAGFFQELVDNVKQGFDKNKELKQSIKQFREEAKKLEQSDALKEARSKFVSHSLF
jgi:hypothetical protein